MTRARRSIHHESPARSPSPRQSSNSSYKRINTSDRNDSEDISEDEEDDSVQYSSRNISKDSTWSSDRSREFIQYEKTTVKKLYPTLRENQDSFNSENSFSRGNESPESDFPTTLYIVMGILLLGICVAFYFRPTNPIGTKRIECPQFRELPKRFTNQDVLLWKSLKVGIENVLNQTPAQPSVFLLAYNDAATSKSLMAEIVNVTANCMQSQNPIQLQGSSFATDAMLNDYGEIIKTYQESLESEGIMFVADVHETPARAAQAFHTICDTVTPFVERSIIFFTLYVDQYDRKMKPQLIHQLVETKLERNWNDIDPNTLRALIGRVTDQVFLLHSENN